MSIQYFMYESIERMSKPERRIPDYDALSDKFTSFVFDTANNVIHLDQNGDTYFNAYVEGDGNEMVTWGILAVGEALHISGRKDIAGAFPVFFNEEIKLYMNSPGSVTTEYWYLMYVNTLATAVYRSLFPDDCDVKARALASADSLRRLAHNIGYDFNDQGYDFTADQPWTNKDIYRQPDSLGGYAYNMLFAGVHGDEPGFLEEAVKAIADYERFSENPWYEIPNGSVAVLTAAWLRAHGYDNDLKKILGYIFDPAQGPLLEGRWNDEPIDGLMMGWRGDTRESAMSSAYSMETLMPLPFLLPAVRYAPETAKSIAWFALHAVVNFPLFYGIGKKPMHQTRPDLSDAVPYEKLEKQRDGHSPVACGDFMGHRSVYGGGYLAWISALMRPTGVDDMLAFDISLTDWLEKGRPDPEFVLYNHEDTNRKARFAPAPVWKEKRPDLFPDGMCKASIYDKLSGEQLGYTADGIIEAEVPAGDVLIIKLTVD